MAMTSSDKMATGEGDVTVSVTTSQSGNVGRERPETKCATVRSSEVCQLMSVSTHASTSPVSVASTASVSVLPNPRVCAGNDDRRGGNGSRNPDACGWLQSVGRLRRKLEEIRPTSSSTTLCRARTVGPVTGRSSGNAAADSRTPVTSTTGSNSAHLRKAAAIGSNSKLTAESTADCFNVVGPSAIVICRSEDRSVSGETLPAQGVLSPFTTFPERSRRDAASEVQRTSTSTMKTNSHPTQLHVANNTNSSKYPTVLGPHRSLVNSADCIQRTVERTSMSSAALDSYSTSPCQTTGDGQTQPVYANFGSRSSASPQLRRWNVRPESGGHSSTATQVGSTDHHHYQFQQYQPDSTTKPHSVPCSPRLQARLAATQPWRPWSPSKFDSPTSMDISQLASSLLLTKVIRDRQDLKSTGNYTGYRKA